MFSLLFIYLPERGRSSNESHKILIRDKTIVVEVECGKILPHLSLPKFRHPAVKYNQVSTSDSKLILNHSAPIIRNNLALDLHVRLTKYAADIPDITGFSTTLFKPSPYM